MKKRAVVTVVAVVMLMPHVLFADGAMDKLRRGAINVVASPLEMFYGMKEANEAPAGGIASALTWGVLNGAARIVVRAAVGIYEIVTCPFPIPKDYKPIISDVGDIEIFLQE